MDLNVYWLGMRLKNPLVLAALTPISHKRINEHVDYYVRAAKTGIGAIVTESFIPIEFGSNELVFTQHDLVPIESGLGNNQYMGCSILGPPYPNLGSITYGKELVKRLKKEIKDTPIVGSLIANFDDNECLVNAAKTLASLGIEALELNFSCPNIVALCRIGKNEIVYRAQPSFEVINAIKNATSLKISLKVTPQYDFQTLINEKIIECIDGITYANACLGLVPPEINPPFGSKFGRGEMWSYSGIYGPFERVLTYEALARLKKDRQFDKLQISAIGGFVDEKHVIEALLLGADIVQLGAVILWKGFDFIDSAISFLHHFMEKNKFNSVDQFRGRSLGFVLNAASDVPAYKYSGQEKPVEQRQTAFISDKCIKCYKCLDRCCLAIQKTKDGSVHIIPEVCSGCGWCKFICPAEGAII